MSTDNQLRSNEKYRCKFMEVINGYGFGLGDIGHKVGVHNINLKIIKKLKPLSSKDN